MVFVHNSVSSFLWLSCIVFCISLSVSGMNYPLTAMTGSLIGVVVMFVM